VITAEDLEEASKIAAAQGVGCWLLDAKHMSFQLHATQARLEEATGMFGFYVMVDCAPRFGSRERAVITHHVGFCGTIAEAAKKAVEAILAHEAARRFDPGQTREWDE
jgi:hypothetical protein